MTKNIRKKFINSGFMFVLPAITILLAIIAYPIIYQFHFSLFETSFFTDELTFVGFKNYFQTFGHPHFQNAFIKSVLWAASCVILQMVLGFVAAIVFNEDFVGRSLCRALVLIPWILPTTVAASTFRWMYHADFGIVNRLLSQLGLLGSNVNWLGDLDLAFWSVLFVNVWKMFPFVMLMILAALQAIPKELYEAAWMDGANILQTFRYITLPFTSAVRAVTSLLLIIWSLNSFTVIYVMTEGGPLRQTEILPIYIYRLMFQNYQYGPAAATAMILFVIMIIFSIAYVRSLNEKEASI